jgi:hypothetical protein
MIARDAALKVLAEAAREQGYDMEGLEGLGVGGTGAEKEAEVEYEGEEGEDAELLDETLATLLPLDGLLMTEEPAVAFFDRAVVEGEEGEYLEVETEEKQAMNTTMPATTNNTTTTPETTNSTTTSLLQGVLVTLREAGMTDREAERLRADARTAAMEAIRDAARNAGYEAREDGTTGNVNLDTLFANIASITTQEEEGQQQQQPQEGGEGQGRKLHWHHHGHDNGEFDQVFSEETGNKDYSGNANANANNINNNYYNSYGTGNQATVEDYTTYGTVGSVGSYGAAAGYGGDGWGRRQLWDYYGGAGRGNEVGDDDEFWEDGFWADAEERRKGKGHHGWF